MSSPPLFSGNDAQPPAELNAAAETLEQVAAEVVKADEPSSPKDSMAESAQLRDWEVLNATPASKMQQQVKDIPRQMNEQLKKLQPHLQGASRPVMQKLDECWQKAIVAQGEFSQKYSAEEVLKMALAVALLFAGGRFSLTIACAQSFHMACWQRVKRTSELVEDSYISVSGRRSLQDASLSHDITTIVKALVLAKSPSDREEVMKRSINLVKCIDASKARDVLTSLWPGVVAVISVLRSRLAFAAGLGANVGNIAFEAMQKGSWLQQRLKEKSASDWTVVGLQQGCTLVSFCLSFYLTRVMNALNSALQGSTTLSKVFFQYLNGQKSLPEGSQSTIAKCALPLLQNGSDTGKEEEVVKWSIALIGFYVQVRRQHQFPFPVKMPLAPLYLMEYCLARLAGARSL